MMKMTNLEFLQKIVIGGGKTDEKPPFDYPPPIARTIGLKLVSVDVGTCRLELDANTAVHANPMGTVHGGVLCDLADAAIGTAHATTLGEGESFTSVDLQINFFRPVWNEKIFATAKPVHQGKTVGRYVCDVTRADGKLIAQVASTVMTLRGDMAKGR